MATTANSSSLTKLWSQTLVVQPATVEFMSNTDDTEGRRFFVVGSYFLTENDLATNAAAPNRTGTLQLWEYTGSPGIEVVMHDTVLYPPGGVYHLKFYAMTRYFAVGSSTGCVCTYYIKDNGRENPAKIIHIASTQLFPEDTYVTSLTWRTIPYSGRFPRVLIITTSAPDSTVYMLYVSEDFTVMTQRPGIAHSIESWPPPVIGTSLSRHTDNVWTALLLDSDKLSLLTGGDDSCLKMVHIKRDPETGLYDRDENHEPSIFKGHAAGVTAILKLPISPAAGMSEQILLTGSYDNHVRILAVSTKINSTIQTRAKLDIGDCPYQFRLMRSCLVDGRIEYRVLVSCMWGGLKILRIGTNPRLSIEVMASWQEPDVLMYASDVLSSDTTDGKEIIVTTSFYQKKLSIFRYDPKRSTEAAQS